VGHMRNVYNILARKPESKIPLGRPRCTWEYRIDLKEIAWECVDWIHVAHNRNQHGNESSGSIKGREFII